MSTKCLICYCNSNNPQSSNKYFDGGTKIEDQNSILSKHLDVIFILRNIFQVPVTQLSNYLKNYPKVDNWICICDKCNELVRGYRAIYSDLMDISRKVEETKLGIIGIVKKTYHNYNPSSETQTIPIFLNITDECRLFIKDHEYNWPTNPFIDGDLKVLTLLNKPTSIKLNDYEDKPVAVSKNSRTRSKTKSDLSLTTTTNTSTCSYPIDEPFSNDDLDFEPDEFNPGDDSEGNEPTLRTSRTRNKRNHKDTSKIRKASSTTCSYPEDDDNPFSNDDDDEFEPDEVNSDDSEANDEYEPPVKQKTISGPSGERKISNYQKYKKPGKQFVCPHCPSKRYTINSSLIKHFKCKHPDLVPPSKIKLGAPRKYAPECYMKTSTGKLMIKVPSKCPHCGEIFSSQGSLRNHIKYRHLLKLKYQCVSCGVGQPSKKSLESHQAQCTGEGPKEKCPEEGCLESVPLVVGLETHFKDKHPERSFFSRCPECEEGFYTKLGLERHLYNNHKERTPFKCDQCGMGFKRRGCLNKHRRCHEEGGGTEEVVCDHCGKTFASQHYLENHVKVQHENEFRWRCDQCGRGFAKEEEHLKVHLFKKHGIGKIDDLKYICEVEGCSRIFYAPKTLEIHMGIHEGKPPQFTCEECGKQFYQKFHLTYHWKAIHGSKLNEEKFRCEVCGAEFGFKDYLTRHKKTVHKIFPQRRK